VADVGARNAVAKTRNVTVSDGVLNLVPVVENACISAIEVVPVIPPAPSTVRLNTDGGAVTTGSFCFASNA
jgi:hypothetical protein